MLIKKDKVCVCALCQMSEEKKKKKKVSFCWLWLCGCMLVVWVVWYFAANESNENELNE